ncbi:MAG: hypothetical protein ACNI3C_00860 [Candidatus Marinarcus sp.]|uniref:hypothetical protein n=1 Tax=Candidatus Marinarcus sp. TaxID=3100987 RepID=UPI003AFF82A9
MELNQGISMITDIIVALCAIATVFLAYNGLTKWKAELKGKAYFENSIELLTVINELEGKIYAFNTLMSMYCYIKDLPNDDIKMPEYSEKMIDINLQKYNNIVSKIKFILKNDELEVELINFRRNIENFNQVVQNYIYKYKPNHTNKEYFKEIVVKFDESKLITNIINSKQKIEKLLKYNIK